MSTKLVGSHADLEVIVDNQLAALYPHSGATWLESVEGARFEVRVTSHHGGRLLVLCAVDGRDVLDDRPASLEGGRGIIIPAGGSYTYRGWRTDNDTTREFLFTTPDAGVSAQVGGDPAMVGQIGIAVFTERRLPPVALAAPAYDSYHPPMPYGSPVTRSASKGVRSAPAPSHSTGIGAAQSDRVSEAAFERDRLAHTLDVYYRDRATLEAMGVVFGLRPSFTQPETGYARLSPPPA